MYHQPGKSQSARARGRAVGESEPGPQQQAPLEVGLGFPLRPQVGLVMEV